MRDFATKFKNVKDALNDRKLGNLKFMTQYIECKGIDKIRVSTQLKDGTEFYHEHLIDFPMSINEITSNLLTLISGHIAHKYGMTSEERYAYFTDKIKEYYKNPIIINH